MNKLPRWFVNTTLLFCSLFLITPTSFAKEVSGQLLPLEITPESVKALIQKHTSFVLINSDKPISKEIETQLDVNKIYYTLGISKASARKAAHQDRQLRKSQSQVLVGTPLEWRPLDLPFNENVIPNSSLNVSAKSLAESLKDNEDILIIDLRGLHKGREISSPLFLNKLISLLPHQVKEELRSISKFRWTIFVDDGQGVANYVAEQLRADGYVLVGVLDGGYPAWVEETNK